MIIGIIGSRRRNSVKDFLLIEEAFLKIYKNGDSICSGGCPKGGDKFAELISKKYKISFIEYPADWKKYGKKAGFIRNGDIAKTSDLIIACVSFDRTGGTEDTIKKFIKYKNIENENDERIILV